MSYHRLFSRRTSKVLLALLAAFAVLLGTAGLSLQQARAQTTNLALNKPVICSSTENGALGCPNAVDGNTGTRWASGFSDPQWIQVDLGATYSLTSVVLRWETAYARSFQIQTASSASGPWTIVYSTTTGAGGVQNLPVSGSGRYVRMYGTVRATAYGYSLWEFEVYGTGTVITPTRTATSPSTLPDLTITSVTYVGSNPPCANQPRDNVVVSNIGGGNAGSFVVSFGPSYTQTVSSLAAGASVTLSFPAIMGTSTATADSTNVIVESNESNNSMTASLPAPTQAPTCTPTRTATASTGTRTPTPTLTRTRTPISSTNLALNKPVVCSSTENTGTSCANAVDGNLNTRWASAFSDPQWIRVDLGASYNLTSVVLRWETAYARSFQIQVSNDLTNWTNLYTTTTGTGGTQTLPISGSGRYVRMNGTVRATAYGYSLWEFEVYGTSGPTNTPSPTHTSTAVPGADFVGSPLSGNAPLAVQFTHINSSVLTSCTWYFGDATNQTYAPGQNFSSCPSVTHTYTAPGSYHVSLSVIKSTGIGNTVTKSNYIQVGATPTPSPSPTLSPVSGSVLLGGGACCMGGVAGTVININASFSAASSAGAVTEMRVSPGGSACATEAALSLKPWEPFVATKPFPYTVFINWTTFSVSVQYRDAAGNLSPVYCDTINVEGFPATFTPTKTWTPIP